MDQKKSNSKVTKNKSANMKSTQAKSTKWWTTPRTQAFIETRESLETAYCELMKVEENLRLRVEQRMLCRQRNHNMLLQSLTHECIQFLVRQEMAKSLDWQAAWEHFSIALMAAEQATQEFRDEIEVATAKKSSSKSASKVPPLEFRAPQCATIENSRKGQSKVRHSA